MKSFLITGPDGCGKTTIIPLVSKALTAKKISNYIVYTTSVIPDDPKAVDARKMLVSPHTLDSDRFYAAKYLYEQNVARALAENQEVDAVIIERGFSSMQTYNLVPELTLPEQQALIPAVDYAIYIDAPFHALTSRLARRKTTDYQDTNLEFRTRVWKEGLRDYRDLCDARGMDKLVIPNVDGVLQFSVDNIVNFIVERLRQ